MREILILLATLGPCYYVYYKTGKLDTSISAVYYTKYRLLWKLSIVSTAYILSTYHSNILDIAAISLLGVAVFPDINIPKIKRIHDIFAVLFFALTMYYIHPITLVFALGAFVVLSKFTSLYWIEVFGILLIVGGLTVKHYIL